MILDVAKFVATHRATWSELEQTLERMENDPHAQMSLVDVRRFHFLYEKTSADLAKLSTFAFSPEICRYLESLVARAYGEIHEARDTDRRGSFRKWFVSEVPNTFRRHLGAFALSLALMLGGAAFGAAAINYDPPSRHVLMPFGHADEKPGERVAREERAHNGRLAGNYSTFSAGLMTHNIRVSLFTLGCGMTAGFGTAIALFYNGVILGAISADYMLAGQTRFLLAWLLPHGSIELPAILVAGQAGFVLGGALLGWRSRAVLRDRLRAVSQDLLTLIGALALMLVWAGIIEAFFSQIHEPVLPYWLKIAFGTVQLCLLALFLAKSGRQTSDAPRPH